MCGITGFFNWSPEAPVPSRSLRHATQAMVLRGPDADGFYERRGVGFGHRRLKVIDLSGGCQPMEDRESGVCLTYNGEIYNYRELRSDLRARGQVFESDSDTEVLLKAYLEWGHACVDRLRGIYAFGIYDPRDETLFLVRDRMGAKPLYYARTAQGIAFASSVAALRCFKEVGGAVDRDALMHYFCTIRTSMGERTLLESVKSLEPGTLLVARRATQLERVSCYWQFPVVPDADKQMPPVEEAIETTREMVENAVQEQMVSDVPLGGFLSGGIDSSVIAAVARDRGEYGAYNVGYGDYGCNEWPHVRMAAEHLGIDCREIHLASDGFVDSWRFLMEQKGLPLTTPNEVPIYHLGHSLKQDYTVALSGEGADEVFGGYVMPYFMAYDYERARRTPLGADETVTATDRMLMRLYGQAHLSDHVEHHFLQNSWMPPAVQAVLLTPEMGGRFETLKSWYGDLFQQFDGCSTLDKLMHLHARINLEGLLNRVDSSTMAASVEARVPFTDHRIAEYLYTLPDEYRLGWRDDHAARQGRIMNIAEIDQRNLVESKRLLRRAFASRIPQEILTRPKVSFPVPFREWLGSSLRDFAAETLRGSDLVAEAVQAGPLQELIEGAGNPSYGMLLWPLVNLAMWERSCVAAPAAGGEDRSGPAVETATASCGTGPANLMTSTN